jgi:hypothetical protein
MVFRYKNQEKKMTLPKIIKDTMSMDINEQIRVTLFPEDNGQPRVDVIQLDLKELEGKIHSIFVTPCEAMEIASALNTAVQFYLYNQEQYRKEVLEPREKIAKKRKS